ncbi:hypothetical protein Tco_1510698 [Tanacetum coccineum]
MFKIYNLCTNIVDFADMALPPKDKRHQYLRFEGLQYNDTDISDFEERLGKIYDREEIESAGFGAYWAESARQILDKGDLSAYWTGISSADDFLGTAPPYTSIKDLMLRLYLRLFSSGRKRWVMISGGQFVAHLAEYFELLTEERLQGLTVIVRDLPVIDMAELVRLQICLELDDTWAWVAPRPERKQVVAAGAAEDALIADEGALGVPAPVQAPQPPHFTAGPTRTMAQRLARVEEDVHEIRGALGKQREVLDIMARDFPRFSTWTVVGLLQMMSRAGVRYTSYANFQIPYVRRTRRRTDDAITSTSQQDEQQPDP